MRFFIPGVSDVDGLEDIEPDGSDGGVYVIDDGVVVESLSELKNINSSWRNAKMKNEFHGSSEFNSFHFIPGVTGEDVSEDVVPDVSGVDVDRIVDAVVIESLSKP